MPEGPTCHRAARDQTAWLAGQKLRVSSPQGRFSDEAAALDGETLQRVTAWGKHIFYEFADDAIVHVHLGLYGKYRRYDNPPPAPRGAVRFRLSGTACTLDLNGPNQCELIDPYGVSAIIDRLGPDPLRDDADPKKAYDRIRTSRAPIGQLLMDQSVIAGLGNIYRAEILWLLKINPRAPGSAMTLPQLKRMWKQAAEWMRVAVDAGRIITAVERPARKSPTRLTRGERFNIYKSAACPRCRTPIEQYVMAGRTVYACPSCQGEPA